MNKNLILIFFSLVFVISAPLLSQTQQPQLPLDWAVVMSGELAVDRDWLRDVQNTQIRSFPIAFGIAREHGGELDFESGEGEGTEFVLLLPTANAGLEAVD